MRELAMPHGLDNGSSKKARFCLAAKSSWAVSSLVENIRVKLDPFSNLRSYQPLPTTSTVDVYSNCFQGKPQTSWSVTVGKTTGYGMDQASTSQNYALFELSLAEPRGVAN